MRFDDRVAKVAASQDNLVALADVRRIGGSKDKANARVGRKQWQRPQRGVYLHGAAPPTWMQAVRAAILYVLGAVASHRTAGFLLGLDVEPVGVELTMTQADRSAPKGVHVYRSRRGLTGVRRVGGIPVTSVERTLIDLAAVLGLEPLERAVESALLRRKTTEERIYVALVREGGRGVRGSKKLWLLMHDRPRGRPARNVFEIRTTHLLRAGGLTGFVRNYPVVVDGEAFEIDNAFVDEMLAVETDGAAFHSTRTQRDKDARRQSKLETAGWTFRRVPYVETIVGREQLISDIRSLLRNR
ncbi:MAG: DUF559 domain-containing protein [Actinobacteria bacterium]|nr:DUF559 domain-containing protein [Actinomycetota bacterium]